MCMKFTLEKGRSAHYIAASRDGAVRIGEQEFTQSLILTADELVPWPVTCVRDLSMEHLDEALRQQPEIIVLGTGAGHVFPPLELQAALSAQGIGASPSMAP